VGLVDGGIDGIAIIVEERGDISDINTLEKVG
jgi:hypothetical protein